MQSNALIKNTCLFHKLLKTEQHASKVAAERAEPEKKTRHSNWPLCDTQTPSFCSIHGEIFHCRRKVLAGCAKPTLLATHSKRIRMSLAGSLVPHQRTAPFFRAEMLTHWLQHNPCTKTDYTTYQQSRNVLMTGPWSLKLFRRLHEDLFSFTAVLAVPSRALAWHLHPKWCAWMRSKHTPLQAPYSWERMQAGGSNVIPTSGTLFWRADQPKMYFY